MGTVENIAISNWRTCDKSHYYEQGNRDREVAPTKSSQRAVGSGRSLNCDYCDLVIFMIGELSECTSHLGEYAANRGLARIVRITRIFGVSVYRRFLLGRDEVRDIDGFRAQTKVCGTI